MAGVGLSSEQYDDGGRRRVDVEVYTSGFIRSLSRSNGNQLGIQLEVDLNWAQLAVGLDRSAQRPDGLVQFHHNNPQDGLDGSAHRTVGLVQIHHSNPQGLSVFTAHSLQIPSCPASKEKLKSNERSVSRTQFQKKQKKGKFGVNKRLGASSLNLRKGTVFRSAVAAISLSMASGNSRGRRVLSEAEASIQISKAQGLDYEAKEEEVLSKLEDLEAQDQQRAKKEGVES